MLKFSKISTKVRGILTVLVLTAITFTATSCKGKEASTVDMSKNYLSVDSYNATNGEVWDELQWKASALFDDKAKEAIVKKQLDQVEAVMKDSNHEDYKHYTERLQNYLVEDVYDLEFSLEDHDKEIEDLKVIDKETKINKYADEVYKNHKLSKDLTQKKIVEALNNNDLDALKDLYSLYYTSLASELFALEKLEEEITKKNEEDAKDKDEDTIGYFTKSEIVSKYKKKYLHQGDSTAIAIKFASQTEADQTLKAFGIKVNKGKFYYLTNTEKMSFVEYKKYYDEFDFNDAKEEDYYDIDGLFGHAAILQLYIAMYNYVFTYHSQPLENIDVSNSNVLDQRSTTKNLINKYEELFPNGYDAEQDDKRIETIVNKIKEDEANSKLISFTAEDANEIGSDFYDLIYSTLKTPAENVAENGEDNRDKSERYTTSTKTIGDGTYLVFKIDQKKTANDEIFSKNITEDDLYSAIKNKEELYNSIIQDLKDEDLTKDYISEKISTAMKDVKVKIFDKEIEISYAQNHTDYNKTLSGAPDNNTVAEFKYNDTVIRYNLTTEDGKGLWDILEYREGTTTAVEIIQTKKIKDSKEYKEIKDEEMALYEESLEYILASFANGGFAQQGYPAELGKYNFLMLYYHSADIDKIINDIFKVANATAKILTDYSSDKVIDFFYDYSKKSFDNFFSITAKQVSVYLDNDEDGKPDDINTWKDVEKQFNGKPTKMIDIAKALYIDIYNKLLASSTEHTAALTAIIDEYNASGRFNPYEGGQFDNNDGNYDPIPTEWTYAKYKSLGFKISTEDITVTNSDSDKDVKIKDKLHAVYNSEGFAYKDFFPSKYLENPADANALVEVDNKVNYFLITGASKPASAKFEKYKDTNNIYSNIYYMYNEKVQKVEDIYNTEDLVNTKQIKAFVFEYLASQTTNLVPTDITAALTAFVNPVLSRYQAESTQQHISINYIANGDTKNLKFTDVDNLAHYQELQQIAIRVSDNYVTYSTTEESIKYNNFHDWFNNVDKLIKEGNN